MARPGIYLFANVTPNRVTVLHASRIERVHDGHLRPPMLVESDTGERWYESASELVLAVLAQDGTVIESFGWPMTALTNVECEGTIEREGEELERDTRWRIPAPASARYLQFYRTDFARGSAGPSPLTRKSLGVYDLKPGGRRPQRPRLPAPSRAASIPITWESRRRLKTAVTPASAPRRQATITDVTGPDGYIKSATALIEHGAPSEKFNFVILSDGFVDGDLDVFDKYAGLLVRMLARTTPFSDLAGRINVYKVSVVSTDSGISNCPVLGAARHTYFQTTGGWNGTTQPGFVGTALKSRIMDAVDTIIPQRYAHCVVTIVNCRKYGGSSPPELGMVFLTMPHDAGDADPEGTFMELAAHECGHVIGHLNEEYNPCNRKNPARSYPNETTDSEVGAGTVWWNALAVPAELNADRTFVATHRFGDPVTTDCEPILVPHSHESMLGAFWGCHNGDPPALPGQDLDFCNPAGKTFYRGMADCRMRNIDAGFCRVCSHLLTQAIVEFST